MPPTIGFATKAAIALEQIRAACVAGTARGVVLMDAGYGADTSLRTEITALGLAYAAGIQPNTTVWPQGKGPLPPKDWNGRGRPPSQMVNISRSRPRFWRSACRKWPGRPWPTGSPRVTCSPKTMPGCASLPRPPRRGMALDRMARGREGADEVLVLDPVGRHPVRRVGRSHQAALAHRTGLPGPEAGGRSRSLRGARLARLPPSRHTVHYRITDS